MQYIFVLLVCLACLASGATAKRKVMPWMCLERCNFTAAEIHEQLQQIHENKHYLSGVSFELFNLGPKSTLVVNNFTNVIPAIKADGLETYAMISSFPYPPEFLDWMRDLWANPQPFIQDTIKAAKNYGFLGYNVDFEPTAKATPDDAKAYAKFLTTFADELHKHNVRLTVDVATWNEVWDWNELAKTSVDTVMVMSTYTTTWTTWERIFTQAVTTFPLQKLGIGLQCNTEVPLNDKEIADRFQQIVLHNVREVDIWASPIPDNWWPWIKKYSMLP